MNNTTQFTSDRMALRLPHTLGARSLLAASAIGVLALSGCGTEDAGGNDGATATSTSTSTSTASPVSSGAGETTEAASNQLTVDEPWMKAAGSGMTAAFGTLTNDGDAPVTITGASADDIAGFAELHETVMDDATGSTVMQKMTDPLVIEPGQSITLEPGADHIMVMDLTCAPMAGQTLPVEITFEDGGSQIIQVPVRDYQGAQEQYSHEGGDSATSPSTEATGTMDGMDGMGEEELPMCEEPE